MQIFPKDWDLKTRIEFLQRKVILNSIAYYEFNTNFLSDQHYDSISRQLVMMQQKYGDISDTQYGYIFADFDGFTGFDLIYRLNEDDRAYLVGMVRHWIRVGDKGGDGNGSKRRRRTSSNSSRQC